MSETEQAAPLPWQIRQRADGSTFADGSAVCDIFDLNGRVVAYDVGYPEAKLILDRVNSDPARTYAAEELLREAEWFIAWFEGAQITPREAGMDIQARRWLPRLRTHLANPDAAAAAVRSALEAARPWVAWAYHYDSCQRVWRGLVHTTAEDCTCGKDAALARLDALGKQEGA